jgi:hypothetical protein
MYDTLHAQLYIGKLSRDAVGYSSTPKGKDPDHTWSSFKKMDSAFRAKHPDVAPALNAFMASEKAKWGELFSEQFKLNSLARFVSENNIRNENSTGPL